jgi:excisionase family DNA binding protein
MNSEPTISVATAARLLRCSGGTVMRLIQSGELRAHRLSERGHWRVERKSLDELTARIRQKYLIKEAR